MMEPHLQQLCDFFTQEDASFFQTLESIADDDDVVEVVGSSTATTTTTSATSTTAKTAPKSETKAELIGSLPSDIIVKPPAINPNAKDVSATENEDANRPGYPYFQYKDYSGLKDPNPNVPVTAPGRIPNFPAKMYAILSRPDLQDIVSWMPHGRSWKVHKPREFEIKVIPTYFEHSKFSSFIRQANGWGFRRMIAKGADRNSYYHEMFLRSTPHLVKLMKRPPPSSKPISDASTEPDFYKIAQERPLPELKVGDEKCNFQEEAQNILAHCNLVGKTPQGQDNFPPSKMYIPPSRQTAVSRSLIVPAYIPSSASLSSSHHGMVHPQGSAMMASPSYVVSGHVDSSHSYHQPVQQVSYSTTVTTTYQPVPLSAKVDSTPQYYHQQQSEHQVQPAEVVSAVVISEASKENYSLDHQSGSMGEEEHHHCVGPMIEMDDHHLSRPDGPSLADVFIEGFRPSEDSFWLL